MICKCTVLTHDYIVDLMHLRAVSQEKSEAFADENEMSSAYVSAKTGDNVSSCLL